MAKRVLLLGCTGKMGTALHDAFAAEYSLIRRNSGDFDASNFAQVKTLVEETSPEIVLNTVAHLGIDPCEKNPEKAFRLNALHPKFLAELSKEKGFLLVHFSTDSVFDGNKNDYYVESDTPKPPNVYGVSKYGGDCFVRAIAEKYFLVRVSILLGEVTKNNQFVEKMLLKARLGQTSLRIADDIVQTPTYAYDVARKIKMLIEDSSPFGLYHIVNEGKASLFELMEEVVAGLGLDVTLERASHRDFPSVGIKNTHTPLTSEKIRPLRPWRDAVRAYCEKLAQGASHGG